MRSIIFIPILAIFILFSAFSASRFKFFSFHPKKIKIIGLYDEDSVLRTMNGFVRANDSLKNWDKLNKPKLDSLNKAYSEKKDEFNRDSLKWSPLFKAIKRRDLYVMAQENENRTNLLNNDRHFYSESLFHPLHEKISNAAMKLQTEDKYDSVMNKISFDIYQKQIAGKLKVVNVTLKIERMVW